MTSQCTEQRDRHASVGSTTRVVSDANSRTDSPVEALTGLLSRARAADTRALSRLLDTLFEMIGQAMRAKLSRWAGAADTADDIAQQTIIRVANHLAECRGNDGEQLVGWTSRIAQRVLLDLLRSSAFQHEVSWRSVEHDAEFALELAAAAQWEEEQVNLDLQSAPAQEREAPAAQEVTGPDEGDPMAWHAVGRRALIRVACAVYARAPASIGELFFRHLIDGASWAELGSELGTTVAGVKRRYQRAQAAFRRAAFAELQQLPEIDRRAAVALLESWGWGQRRSGGRPTRARSRQRRRHDAVLTGRLASPHQPDADV